MTESQADNDVVDTIVLPPDPGLIESLGTHHTVESAVADMIDNAIDAHARTVRVRFLTSEQRLTALSLLDDGWGMDSEQINDGMTIGRRRAYGPRSLGNFGLGLKAAAFSQANVLSVWSEARGADPVGRRLRKASVAKDFSCEVLSTKSAVGHAISRREMLAGDTGTAVILEGIHTAYRGPSGDEAQTWLAALIETVKVHVGVVFHRLISSHRVLIEIEQSELDDDGVTVPVPVPPVDPFGYKTAGYPGYPRELTAPIDGSSSVTLQCHIWPARNDVTGFRMGTRSGEAFQGFYVYRADRLLQIGGWNATTTAQQDRQLARVALEGDSLVGSLVTMNPEKKGFRFEPALLRAISKAVSGDGATNFHTYIADAQDAYKIARRRSGNRKPTARPDKGFTPRLRRTIAGELDFIPGQEPVEIRWKRLPDGEFLDVDFPNRTVWLNSRYRDLLVRGRGGLNDAPLVKALIYLLTRETFTGDYLGARDKDNIMLWRTVLAAAVQEEELCRRQG